ncbi:MAG: YfgM family protein [Candidatus Porifericomitaceae bacterium WSBS_2022_MAG_OTU9]
MDSYEQEDLDKLKDWWRENGTAIMFGLFIGVASVLGWRLREAHLEEQAEAASDIFQELADAAREQDMEAIAEKTESIQGEYADSIYGSFMNLTESRIAVSDNDLAEAQEALHRFIDSSPVPLLADLAKMRLARILIAGRELAEAETLLAELENETSVVLELRGDLQMLQDKRSEAADSYRASYLMSQKEQKDNPVMPTSIWLDLKLENLGIDPEEVGEAG